MGESVASGCDGRRSRDRQTIDPAQGRAGSPRDAGARLDLASRHAISGRQRSRSGVGANIVGDARAELESRLRAAHAEGDMASAATMALREYGPEILGLLLAMLRDS